MTASSFNVGDKVHLQGEAGVVRYIGSTRFAEGEWIGVELDTALGKNDGSVNGVRYFELEKNTKNYGIFVKSSQLSSVVNDAKHMLGSTRSPLSSRLTNRNEMPEEEEDALSGEKGRLRKIIDVLNSKLKVTAESVSRLQAILKDSENERRALEDKLTYLEESLEHKTIDCEMLEEQQARLEDILEKLHSSKTGPSAGTTDEEMASKVDSLTLALLNLKERSAQSEAKLRSEITRLELQTENDEDLKLKWEATEARLAVADQTITELKEELDSMCGSHNLIERLTERNFELEKRLETAEKTIIELEELQDLNEDLAKGHAELEDELRSELRFWERKAQEGEEAITVLKKKNSYFEKTITDYRNQADLQAVVHSTSLKHSSTFTNEQEEEMIKSIQKMSLDAAFNKIKTTELEDILLSIQRSTTSSFQVQIVNQIVLQHKVKRVRDRLHVLEETILSTSKLEHIKFSYQFRISCHAISNCFDMISALLEYNALKDQGQLLESCGLLEALISQSSEAFKKGDVIEAMTCISNLDKLTYMKYQNKGLWDTQYFFGISAMSLYLANSIEIPIKASIWGIRRILEKLSEVNQGPVSQKTKALLSKYLLRISNWLAISDTAKSRLEECKANSTDLVEFPMFGSVVYVSDLTARIIALFEAELNSFPSSFEDDFQGSLASLVEDESLAQFEIVFSHLKHFPDSQLEKVPMTAPSFLNRQASLAKFERDEFEHMSSKVQSMREEVISVFKVMKDKEDDLQEAQLKISLLTRKVNEIDEDNVNLDNAREKIYHLTRKNEDLINELGELKADNQNFASIIADLKGCTTTALEGKFDNIEDEKKYTEKSSLIAEIHSLRNTLHNISKRNKVFSESWLSDDLDVKKQIITLDPVRYVYKKLMRAYDGSQIIPLSSKCSDRAISMSYVTNMKVQYGAYQNSKSTVFE